MSTRSKTRKACEEIVEPRELWLDLLRRTVSPSIRSVGSRVIKRDTRPSAVYRLLLQYEPGRSGPSTVVAKTIESTWADAHHNPDREPRFYRVVAPDLGSKVPHLYHAGLVPGSTARLLLLEDVSEQYRFPPPHHLWTEAEARCLLQAYAHVHSRGETLLNELQADEWLYPAYEGRLERSDPHQLATNLAERGLWAPIRGLDRLVEETCVGMERWAEVPRTILHNDVYPPNGGLPDAEEGSALLLDWEMVGVGLPEMDLAYMFLQPFGSHCRLDRSEVLAYYWQKRREMGDDVPPASIRHARQAHADALLALWLVPVAHAVAGRQYPEGSGPRAYWEAMFGRLNRQLQTLCRDIA